MINCVLISSSFSLLVSETSVPKAAKSEIPMFIAFPPNVPFVANTLAVSSKPAITLRQEIEYRSLGVRFINLDFQTPQKYISKNNIQCKKVKVTKWRPKTLKEIIRLMEKEYQIPENLLLSIARVETRMRPYAINYNGRGKIFNNINDAVAFAKYLIRKGCTNFSVGCFQLHYRSHARYFKSLEDMFNPEKNVRYAAKLLKKLYRLHGYNWKYAVKRYHSGYEISNCIYYTKIVNKLGRCI